MSLSTSSQTARISLFLSRPQAQTARCGIRQSTIWLQITRSVSAISGLILYQQEKQLQSRKQKLRQMLQQVLQSRQASSRMMTAKMTSSRIMRIRLHLQRLQGHMPQELLQVVMYMSAMRQAHPAPQRLFLSTGTIRLI